MTKNRYDFVFTGTVSVGDPSFSLEKKLLESVHNGHILRASPDNSSWLRLWRYFEGKFEVMCISTDTINNLTSNNDKWHTIPNQEIFLDIIRYDVEHYNVEGI